MGTNYTDKWLHSLQTGCANAGLSFQSQLPASSPAFLTARGRWSLKSPTAAPRREEKKSQLELLSWWPCQPQPRGSLEPVMGASLAQLTTRSWMLSCPAPESLVTMGQIAGDPHRTAGHVQHRGQCVCSAVFKLFATPWTVACQDPLSTGFPRQESWSGLFPPPEDSPNPGMEPLVSCVSSNGR